MKGCHELLSPTCCSKQDQLWDKTLVFRVQLSRSWKVPKVQTTQVLWGHFIHSCGKGFSFYPHETFLCLIYANYPWSSPFTFHASCEKPVSISSIIYLQASTDCSYVPPKLSLLQAAFSVFLHRASAPVFIVLLLFWWTLVCECISCFGMPQTEQTAKMV